MITLEDSSFENVNLEWANNNDSFDENIPSTAKKENAKIFIQE